MQAQQTSSFQYRGEVTVSVLRDKVNLTTLHLRNKGEQLLFDIIVSMLCGGNEKSRLPSTIDLLGVTQGSKPGSSCLVNKRPITSLKVDTYDEVKCAYFSATIPAAHFLKSDSRVSVISLYNSYADRLAYIELNDSQAETISKYTSTDADVMKEVSSTNLLIEWRMFISNPS